MNVRALFQHFLLTLRLNFRSPQAIVYGYFVPILFLLAFGSVFRSDSPVLSHEMGQLLTLTILGGACFGLPTALVSERERGVWRRYRLLPVRIGWLVSSTMIARIIIVISGAVLQIAIARIGYGTPLPLHPAQATAAFVVVTISFLGLGLLIAALANDVPAVQALGQCLFLPMILIGGVGVPLDALPRWAQAISAFMPGRYAVEVLQFSYGEPRGLDGLDFPFLALLVIGGAALIAGLKLFRWDGAQTRGGSKLGLTLALAAWVAIGVVAMGHGRVAPLLGARDSYQAITPGQIAEITYDGLPGDGEIVARLAPPLTPSERVDRLAEIEQKLTAWAPARTDDVGQRVRNLLSLAAIGDLTRDPQEGEIARLVFERLQTAVPGRQLQQVLAWVILAPDAGQVITAAPQFGFHRIPAEAMVRERSLLYAKKFLGRLRGKISESAETRNPVESK